MLNVTPSACSVLRNILVRSHAPDGTAVRIVPKGSGLGLTIDALQEGDAIVESDHRLLLVLDRPMADRLTERTLDAEPGSQSLLLI